jgi:hypothetical protein
VRTTTGGTTGRRTPRDTNGICHDEGPPCLTISFALLRSGTSRLDATFLLLISSPPIRRPFCFLGLLSSAITPVLSCPQSIHHASSPLPSQHLALHCLASHRIVSSSPSSAALASTPSLNIHGHTTIQAAHHHLNSCTSPLLTRRLVALPLLSQQRIGWHKQREHLAAQRCQHQVDKERGLDLH